MTRRVYDFQEIYYIRLTLLLGWQFAATPPWRRTFLHQFAWSETFRMLVFELCRLSQLFWWDYGPSSVQLELKVGVTTLHAIMFVHNSIASPPKDGVLLMLLVESFGDINLISLFLQARVRFQRGGLAQLVERLLSMQEVRGSIPLFSTAPMV